MDRYTTQRSKLELRNKVTAVVLVILGFVTVTYCSSSVPNHGFWPNSDILNSTLDARAFTPVTFKTIPKPRTRHAFNRTSSRGNEEFPSLVQRVQRRMTQSREAKWASLSLTVIFILLLLGVCYSKMWKEYRGPQYYHPNLPVLKESVPLIDVFNRKFGFLRRSEPVQYRKLQADEEQLLA